MTQFKDLPPELRVDIWKLALPEEGPAIYNITQDYIVSFIPTWYNAREHTGPVRCLPPRIQVPIPAMYNACRESRAVVDIWMRKKDISWFLRPETQGHILVRAMDPQRDIIYMPIDDWITIRHFLVMNDVAPAEQQNLRDTFVNVAFSAHTFSQDQNMEDIAQMLSLSPNMKKIYIIYNDLPPVRKVTLVGEHREWWIDVSVQPRCEIASFPNLHETVHIHRLDRNEYLNRFEKGRLSEFAASTESCWKVWGAEMPDMTNEITGEIRAQVYNVTVMQLPTWTWFAGYDYLH
ncbi:Ff.00g052440.m01.CDS01 [Fusarium sp. VM40]|nr:Ff.00g052440.m01.CDS01 [Fusarium sp. VM40]